MYYSAIRGAITVKADERDEILAKTKHLLNEIITRNSITFDDIVSIIITGTRDITSVYPAVAARDMGMSRVPLLCCQEMHVEGSLPLCIRVLLHIQTPARIAPRHVYLEGAVILRPDLLEEPPIPQHYTIAIDGPAGAGKSTVAKTLARELDILYLDTGAMYRAIALKILDLGGNPENPSEVIPHLADTDIRVSYDAGLQSISLDGVDVTGRIRTPEVSKAASAVAVVPEVRRKLVELQRQIAKGCSLVMDGRDIGTNVLPNADLKIFLTASIEERAQRRWNELRQNGLMVDFQSILEDIKNRDYNDSHRSYAPLRQAEDAHCVDTTGKAIDEVIEEIRQLIHKRG